VWALPSPSLIGAWENGWELWFPSPCLPRTGTVIGNLGFDPSGECNRFFSQNSRAGKVVGKRLWRARFLKYRRATGGIKMLWRKIGGMCYEKA